MENIDYLIVGQGIAGTMLSYFLLKQDKKILIVDAHNPFSASNVAAGLFNPLTGRRYVKTWLADSIFLFSEKTYLELQDFLGGEFYYKMNSIRFFSNFAEQNDWASNSEKQNISDYIFDNFHNGFYNENVPDKFGHVEFTKTGYIDLPNVIHLFRKKMLLENKLAETEFTYNNLKFEKDNIVWNNFRIVKVIFCEGYKSIYNPYFSWLPFVPAKGEILTIYSKNLKLHKIINKGIFILPIGENKYKVGSTYNWEQLDEIPDPKAKDELIKKLEQLITVEYSIIDHKAGVRPTVKDRRPFIGLHPENNNLGIFNGLGTKGASLAPYFANHFVNFLEGNGELLKEININRYFPKY